MALLSLTGCFILLIRILYGLFWSSIYLSVDLYVRVRSEAICDPFPADYGNCNQYLHNTL